MYNYYEATKNNVKDYIEENINLEDYTREELEEELNDCLWTCDSVTGNGSGSYTFCRAIAKDYVTDNMDLCTEALEEFCVEPKTIAEKFLTEDWEYFDVTIRCFVLGLVINETLDELEEDGAFEVERVCSVCGKVIHEGYCVDEGLEYYCSDDCLHSRYTDEEYNELYNNDVAYWTEWE